MAVLTPFVAKYQLQRLVESERARNAQQAADLAAARFQMMGRPDLARQVRDGYDQLVASAGSWSDESSGSGNAEVPQVAGHAFSESPPTAGMTTREVAEMVGSIGERQVRNLCKPDGPLSATKQGGTWFVDRSSVEDYIAAVRGS